MKLAGGAKEFAKQIALTMKTEQATPEPSRATRRILALDGGGVMGIVSVAFLERIEALHAAANRGQNSRLCGHFDLIGGTSTGAIIATALALGLTTSDIRHFYLEMAPRVFRRRRFRLSLLQTVFDAEALRNEIFGVVGQRRLDTADLRTFLAIVTKRMDTGSAWMVTNNPRSSFWNEPADRSYIGNRNYLLGDLVRASTAAPYYFAPHRVQVVEGEPPGLFVDGGVSPHNNPALALFQMVTIPAYGFGWPAGANRLRIVSIGTGTHRSRLTAQDARWMPAAKLAVEALRSIIADSSSQVLTTMQMLGLTTTPWVINSEIGDMGGFHLPCDPLFTFQRYDVRLERDWLRQELGVSVTERDVADLQQMDNSRIIPLGYAIGQAAAERFVKAEHFGLPR